jgi:hypothetical protein
MIPSSAAIFLLPSQDSRRQLRFEPESEDNVKGGGNEQSGARGKQPCPTLDGAEQKKDKKKCGDDETQPGEQQRKAELGQ